MKKQLLSGFLLLCIVFSSLFFSSCLSTKHKFVVYSLEYFDTATTITGYETSQEAFDRNSQEILSLLEEYHQLYTIYQKFDGLENLCTVNALYDGVHRTVSVDRRILDMLLYAKEMNELTGGKLNIAMGSVLEIWHQYRTAGLNAPWEAEIPPIELLTEAAAHTDINNLILDPASSTVQITDPLMKLDVGAVAKGYAVEMAARYLEEKGITGYVLNVGGNVRTVGTKPNGEKWLVGLENPNTEAEEQFLLYLSLAGKSVVTSGSYQRYYTVNGKNYHHIIDPETLYPSEKYLSVSVICTDSAMGDALSTALFCMSLAEGQALVESLPDVEAIWVMPDESRCTSSGFFRYVTQP